MNIVARVRPRSPFMRICYALAPMQMRPIVQNPKRPSLVRFQPSHDTGHLLVLIYPEALLLRHARQLHVL